MNYKEIRKSCKNEHLGLDKVPEGPFIIVVPGPEKPLGGPDLTHDRVRHSAPAVEPYLGIWGYYLTPDYSLKNSSVKG